MSTDNVLDFLRLLSARADLLDALKVKSKTEVLAAAASLGHPISEPVFDAVIWDVEARLARRRGEDFDARFPLWQTMWGAYYLEYLVTDLVPSLPEV